MAEKIGSDEGVVDGVGPHPTAGVLMGEGGARRHGGGRGGCREVATSADIPGAPPLGPLGGPQPCARLVLDSLLQS